MTRRRTAIIVSTNIVSVVLLILMHINIIQIPDEYIAITANLTSLILWLPQAVSTWRFRTNTEALKGISLLTQNIVIVNTLLWCEHGFRNDDFWLSFGTVFILPLAIMTITLKLRLKNKDEEKEFDKWFTFEMYKQLNPADKKRCLRAINTTDFNKQVSPELLNWESYEEMNDLDKMYWDKELWMEKGANSWQ